MSELGSVFEDLPSGGPRGKDLRHSVEASRAAASSPDGVVVRVPLRLSDEDGYVVSRAVNPADEGDTIRLRLPADSLSPVIVRLRGMGGVIAGGHAGDLYLQVTLRDDLAPVVAADGGPLARHAPLVVLAVVSAAGLVYCGGW